MVVSLEDAERHFVKKEKLILDALLDKIDVELKNDYSYGVVVNAEEFQGLSFGTVGNIIEAYKNKGWFSI